MNYTHILLDLDGTLFDFGQAQNQAFFTTMKSFGIEADDNTLARYDIINKKLWSDLEQKKITKPYLVVERFKRFLQQHHQNVTADPAMMNKCFLESLGLNAPLLPGAKETVLMLLKEGYILSAITNGVGASQTKRLELSGFNEYFDSVFISEKVGFEKPDQRFFDVVKKHYDDVSATNMLVVGDSLSADIKGGNDSNIDTCWINPQRHDCGGIIPTYQIDDITKIFFLLKEQRRVTN